MRPSPSKDMPMRKPWMCLSAIVCLLLTLGLSQAAETQIIIYNHEGKSSIVRNKKTVLLDVDMDVRSGDLLRCERDSMIQLFIHKTAAFRMESSTYVRINNANESNLHFTLEKGIVMLNLKPLEDFQQVRIDTPLTEIRFTAKGGQYWISSVIDPKTKNPISTKLINRKGTSDVLNKSTHTTVTVLVEHTIEVTAGGPTPLQRPITEEEASVAGRARMLTLP